MNHRSYGETRNCKGCRFWSEMTQQSIDQSEIATLRAQRNELLAALREIAAGDGIYGLQAREYKHIARAAVAKAEGRRSKGGE